MKSEDKWALIASAFIPWIVVACMVPTFAGDDRIRDAIKFVGIMWVVVSPLITLTLLRLAVSAARGK
jgi:hypothetical protein